MRVPKGKRLLILGAVLVVIDQVIKILVKTSLPIGGGAFGMAFGGAVGKFLLTLFRLCLFAALCWWITKLVRRKDPVPTGVLVGLTLITAGALGNIIDCLFYGVIFSESTPAAVAVLGGHYAPLMFGKVVDMFYFPLFTWPDWVPLVGGEIFFEPIFNFADSCVTVGAIYLILFQWRFFAKDDEKK